MTIQNRKSFKVVGISVRTTNENGQAAQDIPALWAKFMADGILEKIPNKVDHSIFSIYTHYEKDHTRPYTTILGCQVSSIEQIPTDLEAFEIPAGNYIIFTAKGKLSEGVVYNEWNKIWASDLNRSYLADYEIYNEKSQNPDDMEVDIFVGVNM